MNAIDVAQDHFTNLGKDSFVVPEWGDMEIFYKPITFSKIDEIQRLQDSDENGLFNVCSLIVLALDEHGSPIFKKVNRDELMSNVSSSVIAKVVLQLTAAFTMGQAEKNS